MDKVLASHKESGRDPPAPEVQICRRLFPTVDTRQGYLNILNRNSGIAVRACKVDTANGSIQ